MRSSSYILAISLVFCLVVQSCTPRPRPINYGTDKCAYCSMSIVDRQRAAQVVTSKGKIYSFDAVECMLNYDRNYDKTPVALFLCNSFDNPGVLADATEGIYLISDNLPSPMGAFLTPFRDAAEARRIQGQKDGELYNWLSLKEHFDIEIKNSR